MSEVNNLIKDGIVDLGLNKAQLARQIGMQAQHLNNILARGDKMPIKYFLNLTTHLILDRETLKQAFIADSIAEIENKIDNYERITEIDAKDLKRERERSKQ
jgi:plasmid maintenance system antidote protein VapI